MLHSGLDMQKGLSWFMNIISPLNEINYGYYDEAVDWNIQDYQIRRKGRVLSAKKVRQLLGSCLRLNIFSSRIQAEIEFLKLSNALRILLVAYGVQRDIYLEKTWILPHKRFVWEGSPQDYQLIGKGLGLDFDIKCDGSGSLHLHFSYFDHYQIHFVSHIHRADRESLCNINPFDINTWCFSEKHAMLECKSLDLRLDGHDYNSGPLQAFAATGTNFNIAYECLEGYFPAMTRELRCQFWQCSSFAMGQSDGGPVADSPARIEETGDIDLISGEERQHLGGEEQETTERLCSRLSGLAGSLLMIGHDICSSESAIWTDRGIRYSLPRIVPSFGRSEQSAAKYGALLPDLDWKILAGKHLELVFRPFSVGDAPQLVFPQTQTQRIYGLFYGKLLNHLGEAIPINKALGFIDYRQIQWRKR